MRDKDKEESFMVVIVTVIVKRDEETGLPSSWRKSPKLVCSFDGGRSEVINLWKTFSASPVLFKTL